MYIAEARKINSFNWKNRNPTWESFVQRLGEKFIRTPESMADYANAPKEERDAIKALPGCFVGGRLSNGRRLVQNVVCRSLVTLDADYAGEKDWQTFTMLHDDVACACYPTHSSTPKKPRLRWVFPTTRDMTPDEAAAVSRRVAEWVGIDKMDPSTFDLNRAMYYPSVPKDAPYELHLNPGNPVDVDAVLRSYGADEAWKDASLWPTCESERDIPRAAGGKKPDDPTTKNGILGLFCRTYDVPAAIAEFLPDVYEETATPGRYTYTGGTTTGGAIVYNNGAFLFSNHATDPAGGRSVNAFDLVRIHRFGEQDDGKADDTPVTKLPSYGAMCAWAAELDEVKAQMVAERNAEADEAFADLPSTPRDDHVDPADDDDDDDAGWEKNLKLRHNSTEPEPTVDNIRLILAHDKRLKGRIGMDAFTSRRCAEDPLPWTPKDEGLRNWVDQDDAGLRWYLEKVWHINSRAAVQDASDLTARDNERHPVREYLSSLEWDGTPRVERVLIDYMGAEDTPLNREIAKRWMAAAVRRVFQPGCKFDTVLVLVSPRQGIGKSQFADILGGAWFQDGLPAIGTKDAMQALRGAWIVEVNEMAATKKADDDAIKQFFAARTDRYRESYGRYEAEHPRQCVFVGSTNTHEFIVDNTGGRRFWPVEVGAEAHDVGPRMDAMRKVRDQLWAEAVILWKKDTPSWFTEPEYVSELAATQAQHTQDDEWIGWIESFLDRPLPSEWDALSMDERRDAMNDRDPRYPPEARTSWTRKRQEVTIAEIRNELMLDDLSKGGGGNNLTSRHIGRVLNALPGWRITKRMTPRDFAFGRQKIYVRASADTHDWLR